jgi:hypothetical protein
MPLFAGFPFSVKFTFGKVRIKHLYSAYRKIQESLCMFYTAATVSATETKVSKCNWNHVFILKTWPLHMWNNFVAKSSRVCTYKCGRNWQFWYEISYFNNNIWFGNVSNCLSFKFRFEDITKFIIMVKNGNNGEQDHFFKKHAGRGRGWETNIQQIVASFTRNWTNSGPYLQFHDYHLMRSLCLWREGTHS